jgi:hypothetical protein
MLASDLHPAQRRKLAARMPLQPDHPVILRPMHSRELHPGAGGLYRDLIITSREQNFFDALMTDLKRPDWELRANVMRRFREGDDNVLELHLPVHQHTQVVLFEAVCRTPGQPRVDPKKITGGGIVLRRKTGSQYQRWLKQDGRIIGWKEPNESAAYDPDPAQRRSSHKANAAIKAAIAARKGLGESISEEVTELFVLPPEICAAQGRTILFGVLPLTSTETMDGAPPSIDFGALTGADRTDIEEHLASYLKPRASTTMPRAGEMLRPEWNVLSGPLKDNGDPDNQMKWFGKFLHQLVAELDAFGSGVAPQQLVALLAQIRLPLTRDSADRVTSDIDAAEFLRNAIRLLVDATPDMVGHSVNAPMPSQSMPLEWPTIDAQLGDRLTAAAFDCLTERHARQAPQQPKFDDDNALYAAKGFVRVTTHGDCPDAIHWSGYSESFRILPWWDGDGPGIKITLPSMDKLRKARNNVTFAVPPKVSAALQGDMKALAKGEHPGDGLEIGWLCSFSLPIITLCAFIVLNIFISLLDFFLRWMLWIKICIPIPRSKSGG